jgi:allophanate hydrolase subunit 1
MLEWVPLGERAIRFARPAGVSSRALVRTVLAWPGVIDAVVAREDVAAYFAGEPHVPVDPFAGARDDLSELPREHVLRAVYDGEDVDEVARVTGLSRAELVHRHAAATYTVDAIGFQPGFGYLVGLDPALALPRRSTPRTRVPAGAIGIAGDATCVYPFESPGGWNLVGRVVGATLFDEGGALFQLGDRVRFVPC